MPRTHIVPKGTMNIPMPPLVKGTQGAKLQGGLCPRLTTPQIYFQASGRFTRKRHTPQWLVDQRSAWGANAPMTAYTR